MFLLFSSGRMDGSLPLNRVSGHDIEQTASEVIQEFVSIRMKDEPEFPSVRECLTSDSSLRPKGTCLNQIHSPELLFAKL